MTTSRRVFFSRLGSATALWSGGAAVIFNAWEPGLFVLVVGLGLAATWEICGMLGQRHLPHARWIMILGGGIFLSGSFLLNRAFPPPVVSDLEMLALPLVLAALVLRETAARAPAQAIESIACSLSGWLYVPWLFSYLAKIIYLPPLLDGSPTGQFYVLYLLVVTKVGDTGAYLVGSWIGRHPIAPRISPKKSWEGLLGALVFAVGSSLGLVMAIPGKLPALNPIHAALLGVLLGMIGAAGDLAESLLKRALGAKDSGRMLPGIGGALDLIDSLLFTAPLLYFYLRYVLTVG